MPQNAWTLSYLDVMGLCRLAYDDSGKERATYGFGNRRWTITDIHTVGSFRAITLLGNDSQNRQKKVVSFAGSNDGGDWGLNGNSGNALRGTENAGQYITALRYGRAQNPDYFVGHSLGGGLALYCCITIHTRTATINPSPLFNEVGGRRLDRDAVGAQAINYCVNYEILAAGRNATGNGILGTTPGSRVTVGTNAGINPVDRHLLSNLVGFIEPRKIG